MPFLCFDGVTLADNKQELHEVGFFTGVGKLLQPWKYYLHTTMGRPLIVRTGIWANEKMYRDVNDKNTPS